MFVKGFDAVLGLEIRMLPDGKYSGRFCVLHREKQTVNIVKKGTASGTLAEVLKDIPRNLPAALVLTGSGVLNKSMTVVPGTPDEAAAVQVFPVATPADFYIQVLTQSDRAHVSIVRREATDLLLGALDQAGIRVMALSVGPFVTSIIASQLRQNADELVFDGHYLSWSSPDVIDQYRSLEATDGATVFKVGGENLPAPQVLAFSAAFQLLLQDKFELIAAPADQVDEQRSRFLEDQMLKNRSLVALLAIFGVLLLSYVFFAHLNSENALLAEKVGSQTSGQENLSGLQERLKTDELQLDRAGWNGGYSRAFLLDQVGSTLPRRASLSAIQLLKEEDGNGLRNNLIRVSGSTDDLLSVNNWIYLLKEQNWVKNVKLEKYLSDPERDSFGFVIAITY